MREQTETDGRSGWTRVMGENAEMVLLAMFVFARVFLLMMRIGVSSGYDIQGQVSVVRLIDWDATLSVFANYYAWHPPLMFLLTKAVAFLGGFGLIIASQLVAFAASLGAFFFLRATLSRLDLLWRPAPLAFLYVASSLPFQLQLAVSVNMDALMLLAASATLYFSVRLLWSEGLDRAPLRVGACLVLSLAAGMMTKHSGLVLLGIPALVALVAPAGRWSRRWIVAAGIGFAAVLLVFPYYHGRYYVPHGSFFYTSAGNFYEEDNLAYWRSVRDADPVGFLQRLVFYVPGENGRYQRPMLGILWDGFWVALDREPQNKVSRYLGSRYNYVTWWLLLAGVVAWLVRRRAGDPWWRLGAVFVPFGLVLFAASMTYAWFLAVPGAFSAKTVYVSPLAWTVGYLAAWGIGVLALLLPLRLRSGTGIRWALLVGVQSFVLLNHVVPVY